MDTKKKHKGAHNSPKDTVSSTSEMKLLAAPKSMVHTPPSGSYKEPKRPSRINTPMETHHFVFSQLGLLFFALVFLAGMYWVLNKDSFKVQYADSYMPVTLKQASYGLEITSPNDE